MKAAVLHSYAHPPKYEDFPDPILSTDGQLVVTMKAASIKNLDKAIASGKHYSSKPVFPTVVGVDGVGVLDDGTRVYAMGASGMLAEKAIINKGSYIILPDRISDAMAAALPNVVIGAALALKFRAKMQHGMNVLINGATGVTGKAAIQIAKHYGANKIYATGRNQDALEKLTGLGAHEVISLLQPEEDFVNTIKRLHQSDPIDIVIDYTWGKPAEMILQALKGGGLHGFSNPVRFVTVGGMAGDSIQLSSGTLRSSAIEVLGSGFGSLSKSDLQQLNQTVLPDMMQLVIDGGLELDLIEIPLQDIEHAWQMEIPNGQRLVVMI